jgi:uncharacterized protein YaiL (DUF2058 family)
VGNSLADQLLKAGLVDKTKANKADKERRKQTKQQRKSRKPAQNTSSPIDTEKRERDRELNKSRNEARKQREIAAQIKQLVGNSKHPRGNKEDDTPFYFENKGKIKKMFVSSETHDLITSKRLFVVNCNGEFELVPAETAEKIRQLNPSLVIDPPEESESTEDDDYADYKVPDDLIW